MSERYTILFSLPGNSYAEGAPVLISAGNLLKDNETGNVVVQLKIQNIGEKTIKALRVRLSSFDTLGKSLGQLVDHQYLDLAAWRDETFGQKTAIPLPDAAARSFAAEVTETVFTDNTLWTTSGEIWEPLPEGKSLRSWLGDGELEKQYKLQYGKACEQRPQQVKDLWICSCGAVNRSGETKCHLCGNTLSDLMAVDLEKLKADRDARLAEEERERERQEAEAKIRAGKNKKIALMLAAAGAAAAILLMILKVIVPSVRYKNAVAAVDSGEYDRAIEIFTALGDYKDSRENVKAAQCAKEEAAIEAAKAEDYRRAEELLAGGDKAHAAMAFHELGSYSDSRERYSALWSELTARERISAGTTHTVGLKTDGTVVAVGDNDNGQCDVSDWSDIKLP